MPEATVEPVEDFRSRLRTWLADNMPRAARPGDAMAMSQGRQTDDESSPRSRTIGTCKAGCSTPGSRGSASRRSTAARA